MRSFILAAAAAASCLAALPAGAQTLKPGLWEMTNKMNSPQMDQAMAEMQKQIAAMPPAERKQMEEMMAKQGVKMVPNAGQGMSVQMCMTKEMVEQNAMPMEKNDCKITSQSKSGSTHKMAFSCPNPPSSGEMQWTMASPEAYSSRMTVKTTVQGKTETMTMEGSGRWLKADCGTVKPMAVPKK
jgi:hypothetical protein